MKRILSFAIILVFVFSLAACRQQTEAVEPTESPASPTAAPTEAPTEQPAAQGFNEEDAAKLTAFFETADDAGVKNGEKLFENYDPADPASWKTDDGMSIGWNEEGRLQRIDLWDDEDRSEATELAGLLELKCIDSLEEVYIGPGIVLEKVRIDNCPNLMAVRIVEPVADTAEFDSAVPTETFYLSARMFLEAHLIGSVPNDRAEGDPFEERGIILVPEEGGVAGIDAGPNDADGELYEIVLIARPDEGVSFNGWIDEMADPYSFEPVIDITFVQPPLGDEFVFKARFEPAAYRIPEYEGDAPAASADIIDVEPGESVEVDLDFDGKPDTIKFVDNGPNEGIGEGNGIKITVELGSNPGKVITLNEMDYVESCALRILDCDITDDRLDIIFNAFGINLSEIVIAYRVNDSGSIEAFPIECGAIIETEPHVFMDAHGTFDATQGIPISMRTEIFDSQYITARMTVTAEGFRVISPYRYWDPETEGYHGYRELKRDMKAYLSLDEDAEEITIPAGKFFAPIETDGYSYVKLLLKDGGYVFIHIEVRGPYVMIDGVLQKEYCDIWIGE